MSLGRKILLINNVVWHEAYPEKHPLKNVPAWFKKALKPLGKFRLRTVYSESAELAKRFEQADAIIVSGSPRNAWADDYPTQRLMKLLHKYTSQNKPILGICYGHQLLARAFGSQVQPNPLGWEVGLNSIHLTPQGKKSLLFQNAPEVLPTLQSHRDVVVQLPSDAVLLAKGMQTSIQAFQVGKTSFGVQFHPEMNRAILQFLWAPRLLQLDPNLSHKIRHQIEETPESTVNSDLLINFIQNHT